jgi:hypothetical protein
LESIITGCLCDKIVTASAVAELPQAISRFAQKQAEEKSLPYQTYIKFLPHETLAEREKRHARSFGARAEQRFQEFGRKRDWFPRRVALGTIVRFSCPYPLRHSGSVHMS